MSEEIKEIKSAFESTSNELKSALTTMQDEIKSKGVASKETNDRVFKAEQSLDTVVKSAQNGS
jgi:ribosome recycling factor